MLRMLLYLILLLVSIDSQNLKCHQYIPNCATCSSDFTQCNECHPGFFKLPIPSLSSSVCVSHCDRFHTHLPDLLSRTCVHDCDTQCDADFCASDRSTCLPLDTSACPPFSLQMPDGSCSLYGCPHGYYRNAPSRSCDICHDSCTSCMGPSSHECNECASGSFLTISEMSSRSGTCNKQSASNIEFTLVVSNLFSVIEDGRTNQEWNGTLQNPFIDLRDALTKAAELSAPYSDSRVIILLLKGDHFIPLESMNSRYTASNSAVARSFSVVIKPLPCNFAQNVSLICVSPENHVTILVKIGAYFSIPLPTHTAIQNIVFDFSDSLLPLTSPCISHRQQSCEILETPSSLLEVRSLQPGCECREPILQAAQCNMNHPVSLFDAIQSTSKETLRSLTLNSSSLLNIFTNYNSLFGFDSKTGLGIQLKVARSHFINISTCGSIISSEYQAPSSHSSVNQISSLFLTPFWVTTNESESKTPSLEIATTSFTNIGSGLHYTSEDVRETIYDSSTYRASAPILKLQDYPGEVRITECVFKSNKLWLDIATTLNPLNLTSYTKSLVQSKQGLLSQNLIQITQHKHGVILEGNKFTNNSALLGLVMVDLDNALTRGVLLLHNEFSFNSAFHRAVLLNLHSHYTSGVTTSCSGFHLLNNTFYQNAHRPAQISLIYITCIPDPYYNTDAVDDVNYDEVLHDSEDLHFQPGQLLRTYELSDSSTLQLDDLEITVSHNQLSQNFRSKGAGQLITGFLLQRVKLTGLQLFRNGDLSIANQNLPSFMVQRGAHPLSVSNLTYNELASLSNYNIRDLMIFFGRINEIQIEQVQMVQNWFQNSTDNPHLLRLFSTQATSLNNIKIQRILDGSAHQLQQYCLSSHNYLTTHLVLTNPEIPQVKGSLIEGTIASMTHFQFYDLELLGELIATDSPNIEMSYVIMQDVRASNLIKSLAKAAIITHSQFHHVEFSMRWISGKSFKLLNSVFSNEGIVRLKSKNAKIINAKQNGNIYIYNCSFIALCGDFMCPTAIIKSSFASNKIEISNSTFTGMRVKGEHTLFQTGGGSLSIFNHSYFTHNQGISGGVIRMTSNMHLKIKDSFFFYNSAHSGGAIHFLGPGFLQIQGSHFEGHSAFNSGGVFVFTDNSHFQIKRSSFVRNTAVQEASVGKFVGPQNSKFEDCIFKDNISYSTFTIFNSDISFSNITYTDNMTPDGIPVNILLISSQVSFLNSIFVNQQVELTCRKTEGCQNTKIRGGFLHDIIHNEIKIAHSQFQNACAYEGGALFMNQESTVTITNTQFLNCSAHDRGGALSALNYAHWSIANSTFYNNSASNEASHIYVQDAQNALIIKNSEFQANTNAITIRRSALDLSQSVIRGSAVTHPRSPGIRCLECTQIRIAQNAFLDLSLNSVIQIISEKQLTNQSSLLVQSNQFHNIKSERGGGALFVKWPGTSTISHNSFENIEALSRTSEGGALYLSLQNPLAVLQQNRFIHCKAEFGGALLWNYYEPSLQSNFYASNEARAYGTDQGSYARSLGFIDSKIGKEIIGGIGLARGSVQKEMRLVLQNFRSGSLLPPLFIAGFDRYGQIVTNLQSGRVYTTAKELVKEEQQSSQFEALLSNLNTNEWQNGVIEITNLKLKGEPGKTYEIVFTSPIIDLSLPDTQKYLASLNQTQVTLTVEVKFRKCLKGEAFQSDGECVMCPPGTYLLEAPDIPQECKICPQEAICYGGNQIGPKRGFWRSGFDSTNFIPCFRQEGCLESFAEDLYNPQGTCAPGYFGVICSSCETGYTRSQQFVCSMCPSTATNISILIVVLISFIAVIVILIKCTLRYQTKQRSVFTVYLKILTSHFQLLMLVSSFDLDWPRQVQQFLNSSQTVADSPQQFFSFDCFIQTSIGRPIKRYFLYLITYFTLPLFAAVAISLFWIIRIRHNSAQSIRRIIASLLICFFLLHPSVTRVFFQAFNCTLIDGESYLVEELSEKCWQGDQLRYSLTIGLTGLCLWTLGIPAVSFWLLKRNHLDLHSRETQEKYGFLYKGFKERSYYWEIVMHARKIMIAFISIFLTAQGTMVQSLFLLSVLSFFIYATLRIKPFESRHANQLELLSLFALVVTCFSGIFYLSSRSGKVGFQVGKDCKCASHLVILEENNKWFLFILILTSNGLFFGLFFIRFMSNFKRQLQRKHKKCFFWLCACCSKKRLLSENAKSLVNVENEAMLAQFDLIQDCRKFLNSKEIENYRHRLMGPHVLPEREHLPQFLKSLQHIVNEFEDWKDLNHISQGSRNQKKLDSKLDAMGISDDDTGGAGGSTTRRPFNTCFHLKEASKWSLFHRAHQNELGGSNLNQIEVRRAWEEETESERSSPESQGKNKRCYSKNTFLPPNCKPSRDLRDLSHQKDFSEHDSSHNQSGLDLQPVILKTVQNEYAAHQNDAPPRKGSSQLPRLSPWYQASRK